MDVPPKEAEEKKAAADDDESEEDSGSSGEESSRVEDADYKKLYEEAKEKLLYLRKQVMSHCSAAVFPTARIDSGAQRTLARLESNRAENQGDFPKKISGG